MRRWIACLTAVLMAVMMAASAEDSTLRRGTSGEAVTALQAELAGLGYYHGAMDGNYGQELAQSVRWFQKAHGLQADGIAGRKTLAALQAVREAQDPRVRLEEHVMAVAAENAVTCGVVQLCKNGQPFLTWYFGGVTETTCFRIASVTKWVTAIGLMTLVEQGRIDLDADVGLYLPFPVRNPAYPEVPITTRMLMTHTSSLSPDAADYHPDWSRIGKRGYDPVFMEDTVPGSKYVYADYNGALMGCLIEAVTGESVQQYLNRTVFAPLGLTAAFSPALLPGDASAHSMLKPNGSVYISVQRDIRRGYRNRADPAGNCGYTVGRLYINAVSLTRLAQMLLNGGELDGVRILRPETVALMEADQPGLAVSPYGLSMVRQRQFPRGTWYGHQGRLSGFSSNVYYQKETGITAVLIMNGYDYRLENNIVLPAVTILNEMELLESLAF